MPETKTMELLCRAKAAQSTDQAVSKQDAVNWGAALLVEIRRSKETFSFLFYLICLINLESWSLQAVMSLTLSQNNDSLLLCSCPSFEFLPPPSTLDICAFIVYS